MKKVDKDINLAKRLLNGETILLDKRYYGLFDNIYSFTNEYLVSCFNNFDIQNKDCLTVLGSSDQAFDLFLRGAKSIDTFDINKLTKYYFDLKKAFLLSKIGIDDDIDFFYKKKCGFLVNGKNIDALKIYEKISKYLSACSLKFWDELYSYYNYKNLMYKSPLFFDSENNEAFLKKEILYLNRNNYEILKDKVKHLNINFINSDIRTLKYKLKKKYDFMYFSNISQYSQLIFRNKNGIEMYKDLCLRLFKKLNENGEAVISYIFSIDVDKSDSYTLLNSALREKVFKDNCFSLNIISPNDIDTAVLNDRGNDGCIIYKKEKKW